MDITTFRAKSMQDALTIVHRELGPDAAVLHTREVRRNGLFRLFGAARQVEVTASASVNVPSRLPNRAEPSPDLSAPTIDRKPPVPAHLDHDYRKQFRDDVKQQLCDLQSMVEQLCTRGPSTPQQELPDAMFEVFTDLIESDVSEELARELLERVRAGARPEELADGGLIKQRLAKLLEAEIQTTGPIEIIAGRRRTVALVGPTGVGKTTTIAKLAANYRLREKKRVGLITVDTYRIAAVEQLRTYADIIDLPMEVVSTPKEMREARQRLANLDLVLIDTAGRSPRDEVQIQQLRSMLTEAEPDEVHVVLSCVAGARSLATTASKFAEVGANAMLITKLDEAAGLGNILPLVRQSGLPLSYLTDGQNVPDDIRCADRGELARLILGLDSRRT